MAVNYVKFQRGSQSAYDALKTAGKLDDNTLYFIYPEGNQSVGALYMGQRIISGGDITIASATLDDLADVIVSNAQTNSFLVKDGDNWVAKELTDVVDLIKENFGDIASKTQVFQGVQEAEEDASTAISRIVGETLVNDGDIAVLKKLIANDKYEYTSYVYTNQTWAAMDGNYNASNVYFDSDFTFTEKLGTVTIPSSGSTSVAATGKNIKEFLAGLFAARKLPSKTAPAVTVTSANSKSYEVGSKATVAYSATLSTGSYTYGPATGITPASWSVVLGTQTLTTASGTFDAIDVEDTTNIRIAATAQYEDGAVPKDNLGSVLTTEEDLNKCQIKAGSAVGYGSYIKGYRNSFYGSKVTPVALESVEIRKLSNTVSTTNTISMSIADGAKQVIIAVPAGRKVTKVADEGAFGTDIFSSFAKSVVSVGGADATAEAIGSYAKDYNVYVYAPSVALGSNTYTVTIANE